MSIARQSAPSAGRSAVSMWGALGSLMVLAWSWLGLWQPAQAQPHTPWKVECVATRGFHDGDTFACVPGGADPKVFVVRVAGADAPETGQAHWRAARHQLRTLLGGGATVSCYKTDRYGREICRVQTPEGTDAALALVASGAAWHSVAYVNEQSSAEAERYRVAEAQARTSQRGLWSETDPMPPWKCRSIRKKRQRCR